MDDGLPGTGRVMTYTNSFRPDCVTVANDAYLLTSTAIGCNLMFLRVT